jgi:HAD superfamily hydrolase (TIGR01459 family)
MPEPRLITSIDAIADEADAFLLDQFGTLHDGERLYPGVAAALGRLRRAGKRVIILSNSGKRAAANADRLGRLGLGPDLYDAVLTSGEVAWRLLAARAWPAAAAGDAGRCLVLARGAEDTALAGLDVPRTEAAAEADFILLLGSEADRIGLEAYRARLGPAARRGIPCLCANPDKLMVLGDGRVAPAPGAIAALYEDMGGPVTLIGKPGAAIYEAAFALLAPLMGGAVPRARVWAVGDSLEHDIRGAAAQGCRSLLLLTGIAEGWNAATLAAEMARQGAEPDAVARRM